MATYTVRVQRVQISTTTIELGQLSREDVIGVISYLALCNESSDLLDTPLIWEVEDERITIASIDDVETGQHWETADDMFETLDVASR